MKSVENKPRNRSILSRYYAGEKLIEIHKDWSDLSYARVVDIVAKQRVRMYELHEKGISLEGLSVEYGLSTQEISSIIEKEFQKLENFKLKQKEIDEEHCRQADEYYASLAEEAHKETINEVESHVNANEVEEIIKGVEAAGKTVAKVIVDGSRIEVITDDDTNICHEV